MFEKGVKFAITDSDKVIDEWDLKVRKDYYNTLYATEAFFMQRIIAVNILNLRQLIFIYISK